MMAYSKVEIELRKVGSEVGAVKLYSDDGVITDGRIYLEGLPTKEGGELYFNWVRRGDGWKPEDDDYDYELRQEKLKRVEGDFTIYKRERKFYGMEDEVKEEILKGALKIPQEGPDQWLKDLKEKVLSGRLIYEVKEYKLYSDSDQLSVYADTDGCLIVSQGGKKVESDAGREVADLMEEVFNGRASVQEVLKFIEQEKSKKPLRRY